MDVAVSSESEHARSPLRVSRVRKASSSNDGALPREPVHLRVPVRSRVPERSRADFSDGDAVDDGAQNRAAGRKKVSPHRRTLCAPIDMML
jgi:hypothetical protein